MFLLCWHVWRLAVAGWLSWDLRINASESGYQAFNVSYRRYWRQLVAQGKANDTEAAPNELAVYRYHHSVIAMYVMMTSLYHSCPITATSLHHLGDYDCIIGMNLNPGFAYYENTGSRTSPAFSARTGAGTRRARCTRASARRGALPPLLWCLVLPHPEPRRGGLLPRARLPRLPLPPTTTS